VTSALGVMTRAVVVATAPGALAVVGGLPLAVRAVLTLRELGVSEIGVVAGAQDPAVAAALGRRGLTSATDGLSTLAASAAPALVVGGDVLFDGAVLAPLLASVDSDPAQVVRPPGTHPGHVWAAVCSGAVVSALVSHLRRGTRTLDEAWKAVRPPAAVAIRPREGLCLQLDAAHPAGALTDASSSPRPGTPLRPMATWLHSSTVTSPGSSRAVSSCGPGHRTRSPL
jgi:hypothetical protein